MDTDFPTLKSYLDWRTAKRDEYRILSAYLRQLKGDISQTMRGASQRIAEELKFAEDEQRKPIWHSLRANTRVMQGSRIFMRQKATFIMQERRVAKQIARESWTKWQETNQP